MNRERLKNFINKHHLGGAVESAMWEVKNGTLSTACISANQSLVVFVSMKNFECENTKFGVFDVGQFSNIINLMDLDIDMSLKKVDDRPYALSLSDGSIHANYSLSEMAVIPKNPKKDELPEQWDATMTLDSDKMALFTKAVGALRSAKTFTLVHDQASGTSKLVVGHSNVNTNTLSIDVDVEFSGKAFSSVPLSAKHMKEIVQANREADEFVLDVSSLGLARVQFDIMDFKSEYFLVEEDED
jgi:hypothetical protein